MLFKTMLGHLKSNLAALMLEIGMGSQRMVSLRVGIDRMRYGVKLLAVPEACAGHVHLEYVGTLDVYAKIVIRTHLPKVGKNGTYPRC
jgi:hypothetical protein